MSQPNEPVNTSTMVSLLCDLFSFGYIHCLKRSLVLPGYVLLKKHEVKVIQNTPFSQKSRGFSVTKYSFFAASLNGQVLHKMLLL